MDTRMGIDVSADPGPLSVAARMFCLSQGLYSLSIDSVGSPAYSRRGISLPCIQLTSPPSSAFDPVDILTAWDDQGAWLGPDGGTVVVRSPPGGGQVLVTLYDEIAADSAVLAAIDVRRLDRPRPDPAHLQPPPPTEPAPGDLPPPEPTLAMIDPMPVRNPHMAEGELNIEVTLHVQRLGDCAFPGGVWCGNVGQKLQVEAFGIRPLEQISVSDIEYRAFGPAGRETRWVSEGTLCGTRGRGIPLTGFAVRLAPHVAERYDVIYQGAFFASGVTVPVRNGDSCIPLLPDDHLEAVNIRIIERGDL
jgi:hypothetical protein